MPRRYRHVDGRSRVRHVYVRASHRHKNKFPLLPAIGLLAGVYAGTANETKQFTDMGPGYQNLMNGLSVSLLGRDIVENKWDAWPAIDTYGLTLVGYVAHKFLNWVGVNKKMPDSIAL